MKELEFFKIFLHTMIKGDNLNWHERNSGNMCYRLTAEEVAMAETYYNESREYDLGLEIPGIKGETFIVTGSGKYFMNAYIKTDEVVGIIKVSECGSKYTIVYGFINENMPTSELPSHLLIQQDLKARGDEERTVYHCHPTHINAMTYLCKYDSYEFTAKLWKCATEASVFVPKGVGLLVWMMPGSIDIGVESCKMLEEFNIVSWVHHGVFAAGNKPDETLGMVHVAEKAAEIFIKLNSVNIPIVNNIKKENIVGLVNEFGIEANSKVIEKL